MIYATGRRTRDRNKLDRRPGYWPANRTRLQLNTASAAKSHNNCGGVCVRGGQKHWLHLLSVFPDRYAQADEHEQRLRAELGDVAILRERRGGISRPLTLAELRRRHQATTASGSDRP